MYTRKISYYKPYIENKIFLTNQIHMGTLPPGLIQKDGVGREKQTFILPFQLNKKI